MLLRVLLGLALSTSWLGAAPTLLAQTPTCQLGTPSNPIQHIIYLQFDNVHYTRDNPNVPSDLEQMPHLLSFLTQNGTLVTQQHTPLISHTGGNIVSVQTGLYPDHTGLAVTNTYRYFTPQGPARTAVAFAYWTDPLLDPAAPNPSDTSFNMLTTDGKNTPAPWVPFTRAGCDVGIAGLANSVLENTTGDIVSVFGADSPEAAAAKANPEQASADYIGIGVHCAASSSVCAGGQRDRLPQEPGGYDGFQALFGHKAVQPVIAPNGPLQDMTGKAIQGFPGFDGLTPSVTLGYLAAMQEHGIPITWGYISDAHDPHSGGANPTAYGPGQAEYVQTLKAYDDAFGAFFDRLAHDGIDASNTLVVVTADENDHFVGGPPSPADCDGLQVPCTYAQIGEISTNLTGLLATQAGLRTPFSVHADSAPAIYLDGQPDREAASVVAFASSLASLRVDNPYTGASEPIVDQLAGEAEMRLLHMLTADPLRTPTLISFQDENYFGFTAAADCSRPCVALSPGSAWNHGDYQPDITTTWLGLAGPGVHRGGVDTQLWGDHTDTRPTVLALTGLKDSYVSDGRALFEALDDRALPANVVDQRAALVALAQAYKRINAPVGELGLQTLGLSSEALKAGDAARLAETDARLDDLAVRRDALAARMRATLDAATFQGQRVDPDAAAGMVAEAEALLASAR